MSQLDAVVARARAPGQFVEERRFVLSREKAVAKQREFTLRHPSQAVLELIQGAVFAGATTIAVETHADSLMVAWVGAPAFTEDQLENWLDYLFADRGAEAMRPFVQLAVGLNALLQRNPKVLRVESGGNGQGVRMDLDKHGNVRIGAIPDPPEATYVFVEFSRGWFPRFSSADYTREQHLVEERCLYTPVPILLNGGAPFGYRGSRHIEIFGADHQQHFDDGQRRGVVAITSNTRASVGFRIVVGGVWINTLSLEELSPHTLLGVICDDRLRKTADHADIVQDRRYVELLHSVQPHATAVLERLAPDYTPPRLPPIPKAVAQDTAAGRPRVEPEPLPGQIPSLAGRGSIPPTSLVGCEAPLFIVSPAQAAALEVPEAAPDRFPWQILVLTEGQHLTLSEQLPGVATHRLSSPADLDFVRRVMDRQEVLRTHTVRVDGATVTLRLHLEGRMPDWGRNRAGLPYCVRGPTGVASYGVLRERTAWSSGGLLEHAASQALDLPVDLPRVSLLVVRDDHGLLEPGHVRAAMHQAWRLAAPEDGPAHRPLLCALFGALAVPQFLHGPDRVEVAASLPVGWPAPLRHVPLATTRTGPLSLQEFLHLLGSDGTAHLVHEDELVAMDALETRFGHGHLVHDTLEGQPLFGVGRIADRWIWLEGAAMWTLPAITQLCWVGAHFHPRDHDDQWVRAAAPSPILVAAHRSGIDPSTVEDRAADWQGGWELLHSRLDRLSTEGRWGAHVRKGISPGRLEGLGRLALAQLTAWLGLDERPLFVPSDNGARRPLAALRSHPAARVSARHGAVVAEPWTFLLTADEHAAVATDGRPGLRFDDAPEVWDSLIASDDGWLIRREVRQGGLTGWLGLRFPYDPTAGVLVRTMGRLLALPDIDAAAPCHGLLWPTDGTDAVAPQQAQLVRLAGLQLYQDLIPILRDRRAADRVAAANAYALRFVLRASARGPLSGAAHTLARLVQVHTPDGEPWGPFSHWLDTAPPLRPALPIEVDDAAPFEAPEEASDPSDIAARLREALGDVNLQVRILIDGGPPSRTPVFIDEGPSHLGRVVVRVVAAHPLVGAALAAPGRAREMVLLEAARQVVAWAAPRGADLSLPRAQQALLAQRLS